MSIWAKVGISLVVIVVFGLGWGIFRETIGFGATFIVVVEAGVLFYIWTRPNK